MRTGFGLSLVMLPLLAVGMTGCSEVEPTRREMEPTGSRVVNLDEAAAREVLKIMREQNFSKGTHLRFSVAGDSVNGFTYGMNFDDNVDHANDIAYRVRGVSTVVDKKIAIFLEGTTVRFEESPKRGFQFDNPNAVRKEASVNSSR